MPSTLTKDQRTALEKLTLKAREAAEVAARAALDNLAVHEERPRAHLDEDQRRLRNRLRARGRALGDRLDPGGSQSIDQLAEAAAYEHWHRLLFTRFLADNHLLHTGAEHGGVPVTLEECDELAPELGARDGFELACRFASETLPGIFRRDAPVLDLRPAPNQEVQLRCLLDELPAETFRTDDALGWTYQSWQAKRKDEVNKSGVKIGAREQVTSNSLPHWQQGEAWILVTWRLADSLPAEKLHAWQEDKDAWFTHHRPPARQAQHPMGQGPRDRASARQVRLPLVSARRRADRGAAPAAPTSSATAGTMFT